MSKRRSVASSSCSYSTSSNDSTFDRLSCSNSPNEESVRATLDMYVTAARVGREAYARGDLKSAVQQFDQALALELQTELDCIYDPSIGMVSGLVRQEVSERIQTSPRHSPANVNCNNIMQALSQIYKDAEAMARLKPTDPKLYLRMGAALCCANEWEKARHIYTEGMNVCKDRKELKLALKRLGRMEQITSGKDIPAEPYEPSLMKDKKSRTLPLTSGNRSRRKSSSLEALDVSVSPANTLDNRRRISKSPGVESAGAKAVKVKARRVSSFGRISRPRKVPIVDHSERESWSRVFQGDFCREQVQMKPSAITQMRRLSIEYLDQSSDDEHIPFRGSHPKSNRPSFAVVNFQSMKIESDDSELEDN